MKKNLAVRIGAIVMVLMVAFFSILPELVSAEGDSSDLPAEEEIVAEADISDASDVIADVPESAEEIQEPEDAEPWPETPAEEDVSEDAAEPEIPDDAVSTEEPEVPENPDDTSLDEKQDGISNGAEEPAETPETPEDTENKDDASEPADALQPEEEATGSEQTEPEDSGEMDTIEDYLAFIEGNDLVDRENENSLRSHGTENDLMELVGEFENDEDDFVIEGTTLVRYNGTDAYVAIPGQVTVIGDGAFAGNTAIVAVAFPANLQSIGNSAFSGCRSLTSVSVPDTVTSVGAAAFSNCSGLAEVYTGTGSGMISSNEFANCISLQSIAVPEGISRIAAGAFSGCSNLSSISLPSTTGNIDASAFDGDVNLASISVSSGSYSSYDGCVYTADGGQLLICPPGKTGISFSPGMRSIASGAFSGCNYLLSAVIPEATGSIGVNAFSGSAIKAVTIPTGVTSIGLQSGWTPNVVYGYSGSTAEAWAHESNYVFESLDGSSNPAEPEEEHIEDPDPTNHNPGGGTGTETGGGTPGVNLASSSTGTVAAISRNASNRSASTPKTGVEDYSIYFLFGGVFLVGIALIAYSRKLRIDGNK